MWAPDCNRYARGGATDRIIDELVKISGLAKEIDLRAGQCDHFTAACYKLAIIIATIPDVLAGIIGERHPSRLQEIVIGDCEFGGCNASICRIGHHLDVKRPKQVATAVALEIQTATVDGIELLNENKRHIIYFGHDIARGCGGGGNAGQRPVGHL